MAVYLKIENCGGCPFIDHSGAFTKGGAQWLCHHRNAPKSLPGFKKWHQPLLNPENPTKVPEKIPDWCPLRN